MKKNFFVKKLLRQFHQYSLKDSSYLNTSSPNPRRREKLSKILIFTFLLWCLKKFYEGLKGLHKIF